MGDQHKPQIGFLMFALRSLPQNLARRLGASIPAGDLFCRPAGILTIVVVPAGRGFDDLVPAGSYLSASTIPAQLDLKVNSHDSTRSGSKLYLYRFTDGFVHGNLNSNSCKHRW